MTNPIRQFTNPEAELRVIGSALIDPEAIGKLTALRPDDFANMAHRNIWDALIDLGPVADWATVKTWLDRRAILADVEALIGPVEVYLLSAAQLIPTALNIDGYAADVVDMARRRELNAALSAAATANFKGEPLPAISSKIVQTMARIEPAEKRQTLADAIAEYSAEREGERDGTRTGGIPSGIGDLDRLTNGWKPGNLIVVAGPTGGGKTRQSGRPNGCASSIRRAGLRRVGKCRKGKGYNERDAYRSCRDICCRAVHFSAAICVQRAMGSRGAD
jgi:replicative DNA helicase